jgi:hypothetical protein
MKRLLALVLLITGCARSSSYRIPNIQGCTWSYPAVWVFSANFELYTQAGQEAAAVVVWNDKIESSQACIFDAAGIGISGCTFWQSGQEGLDHIGEVFSRYANKGQRQ